jgi:hypothetical protein
MLIGEDDILHHMASNLPEARTADAAATARKIALFIVLVVVVRKK